MFKLLILELHHGFSWVTEMQQHTQATITDEPAENLFADLEGCSQKSISNAPGGYRRGKKKRASDGLAKTHILLFERVVR
ncbi:hypothetical protein EDI28_07425 [Photobacterium chitinilyticum]|uniref:Uncharacterized protein n=1 Tax=Photobacterium chitinilyticum TaxID=2485123 RepID=A0A3S3S205_9GAMM|nr:hypothetical protein EDI28_07425 [Photobacterium chitinilyticum]